MQQSFDPIMALELADLCKIVYPENGVTVTQARKCYGVEDWNKFDEDCSANMFTMKDGRCVFVFRGTDSIGDAFSDVQFLMTPWIMGSGLVHGGFSRSFVSKFTWLRSHLEDYWSRNRDKVYVTGHSLGGAEASLFGYYLGKTFGPADWNPIYTFGCPRVGDKVYADTYPLTHYRVVDDIDLVPHLPVALKYRHEGVPITYNYDTGKLEVGDSWWDSVIKLLIRFYQHGILGGAGQGLTEHNICKYVSS